MQTQASSPPVLANPANAKEARLDALYRAAVIADQNAKLSVFATRPAINSPLFNWIVVREKPHLNMHVQPTTDFGLPQIHEFE